MQLYDRTVPRHQRRSRHVLTRATTAYVPTSEGSGQRSPVALEWRRLDGPHAARADGARARRGPERVEDHAGGEEQDERDDLGQLVLQTLVRETEADQGVIGIARRPEPPDAEAGPDQRDGGEQGPKRGGGAADPRARGAKGTR